MVTGNTAVAKSADRIVGEVDTVGLQRIKREDVSVGAIGRPGSAIAARRSREC